MLSSSALQQRLQNRGHSMAYCFCLMTLVATRLIRPPLRFLNHDCRIIDPVFRKGGIMALFKALPLGAFLTWIVSLFIGSAGSTGGYLAIHKLVLADHTILWSWPLFVAATGLALGILLLMK